MKRILLATAGVAVVAVFAATLGSAQPDRHDRARRCRGAGAGLPKLPADIAKRKRFIVGVKCDAPPFGYHQRPGQERRLRRRDRQVVRPLRVRP